MNGQNQRPFSPDDEAVMIDVRTGKEVKTSTTAGVGCEVVDTSSTSQTYCYDNSNGKLRPVTWIYHPEERLNQK